jgi:hypothetical protein
MAYGKIFHTSYKSYNGWEYYMEFFVKDYVGAPSEISLGQSGPVISYDTDTEDRDNPILASQMEIPFIVNTGSQNSFIENLRDTYNEQDVYVHLYKSTSANVSPLWSGFLLMDLSDKEDKWYPFEVKLKATDGLSLLKDRDFCDSDAVKPYQSTDMFFGPDRFTDLISLILQKVGAATSDEGAFNDASFRTSVNWYNAQHTGTGQTIDPLYYTKGKVSWTHKSDDNGNYTTMNSYDVLKEIMKTWHCRIVYWNHVFWIIQIPEYNALPGGTNLNPDNIPTRIYTMQGTPNGNEAYVGSLYNSIYQLSTGVEIEKLTGTKYQFYPRLKSVTAQYLTGGGTNYYGGFPTWNGTTLDTPYLQQTIIDADAADSLFLSIPLNVSKTTNQDLLCRWRFRVEATDGTTTKYLKLDGGVYTWENSSPAAQYRPLGSADLSGTSPAQYLIFDESLPTDSAFVGAWDFTISMTNTDWATGQLTNSLYGFNPQMSLFFGPYVYDIHWSNIPGTTNPFEGQFLTLNSSSGLNIAGQTVIVETSLSDSANYDFGEMQYGDSQDASDPGNLLVWDGAAWVQTNFTGQWGVGTLVGTNSFTSLLMNEYIKGQASNIQIINARLMVSVSTKDNNDGTLTVPNYINPVGRIRESVLGDVNYYVFRRGSFSTATDEWDFEGWSVKDETPGTTTTTTTVWGPNGPMEDDNGPIGF